MKTGLIAVAFMAAAVLGWQQYESYYYSHTDHEFHKQCPSPDREYYDCEWWPKSDT